MTRPRLQAALLLLLVFAVGAVAGGATATAVISRRLAALFEGSPKESMARIYGALLDRKLHLSREQREQIERMVYEDHPAVAKQLQRIEPELAQLRHARHLRILAVLTPEQRTLAEQLDEKNERRHRDEIDLPPP